MRSNPDWVLARDLPPETPPWWRRVPGLPRLVLVTLLGLHAAVAAVTGAFWWLNAPAEFAPFSHPGWGCPHYTRGGIAFHNRPRLNILLAGVDYDHDPRGMPHTRRARTDSLMVVSLCDTAEFCNIVSIPRDLLTPRGRINEAYSRGGIPATLEAVTELGIEVDHYIFLKIYGAKKVFDALGGLEVDVPRRLRYQDHWARLDIDLQPGRQILTGDQLLEFARYLDPSSADSGRQHRQRQLLQVMLRKLKDPATILKLPELAKAAKGAVETDLRVMEMVDLAMLYQPLDPNRVKGAALVGDDRVVDGAAVVVPYEPANRATVRALLR